ncbi:hypothetical protein [Salinibacter grassmerensis]|uniref:hypothetical protein n=1 Tax=Salinibacter grassmerensis TaxID=3040353 RepID=UPI0021E807B0|nr:hypothetical protein [Salinibacter grassmerensis]
MAADPDRPAPPGDEEIETTFRRLRREGRSRLEALRVILDGLDVSLADAKRLLASNDTWAEARAATGQEPSPNEDASAAPDDPVPPAPA